MLMITWRIFRNYEPSRRILIKYTTTGPELIVDDITTIYALLTICLAKRQGNTPLVQNKEPDGPWSTMMAVEFNDHVRAIARGLIQFGIRKGEAASIFSATSVE